MENTPDNNAQKPFPFPTAENMAGRPRTPRPAPDTTTPSVETARIPTEDTIDHGVEESFPASDPVSVSPTRVVKSDEVR